MDVDRRAETLWQKEILYVLHFWSFVQIWRTQEGPVSLLRNQEPWRVRRVPPARERPLRRAPLHHREGCFCQVGQIPSHQVFPPRMAPVMTNRGQGRSPRELQKTSEPDSMIKTSLECWSTWDRPCGDHRVALTRTNIKREQAEGETEYKYHQVTGCTDFNALRT